MACPCQTLQLSDLRLLLHRGLEASSGMLFALLQTCLNLFGFRVIGGKSNDMQTFALSVLNEIEFLVKHFARLCQEEIGWSCVHLVKETKE